MTPNIVHFIWFTTPTSRPFGPVNELAVKAAKRVQNPDQIIVHCNQEPVGNPHWDAVRDLVTVVHREPVEDYHGIKVSHVQYQADIARLQILYEQGGIYLDTDMVLLKPVNEFLDGTLTFAKENWDAIGNAAMMVEKGNPFMARWLEHLPEALGSQIWAYHAVLLPDELLAEDPTGARVLAQDTFFPFDLKRNYLFDSHPVMIDAAMLRIKNSYGIHMAETYWKYDTQFLDMDNHDCLFGRLYKQYAS